MGQSDFQYLSFGIAYYDKLYIRLHDQLAIPSSRPIIKYNTSGILAKNALQYNRLLTYLFRMPKQGQ